MKKKKKIVRTKIIATLGPASSRTPVLRKMYTGGLDVARLNFSHGSWDDHRKNVELIRQLNKKMRRAVKIMQDLEGFRVRVGTLAKPIELKRRQRFYLTQEEIVGSQQRASFDYTGSLRPLTKGTLIYVDDGKILLRVRDVSKHTLTTEVISGGILKGRKGINIPDVELEFETITRKDFHDIEFAITHKLDYIAASFVRTATDIELLRSLIHKRLAQCKIYAKIESRQALKHIDAIIAASDGIIIARGDLGICVPIYQVPVIQKELIKKCNRARKPVVVATQMLDSMTTEEIPTRAEVTDVANAILDGTDFVLISAETAIGNHPHKVVAMMNKIIKYTEDYQRNK